MKTDKRSLSPREKWEREARATTVRVELAKANRSMAWLARQIGVSAQFVSRSLTAPYPKFSPDQFKRFMAGVEKSKAGKDPWAPTE